MDRIPSPASEPALPLSLVGPFVLAAKAGNLSAQLDALKALAVARLPSQQDAGPHGGRA